MKSFFGPVRVKVWGDHACFTRPECKVDRVSYPIMTPTAARGVLEAIYWKPEMLWRVRRIINLKTVQWFSRMLNEVNGDKGVNKEWSAMQPFNASDYRDQRHMLGLRDVAYIIEAEVVARSQSSDEEVKHRDTFQRRVRKGQCAYQPFLGVREFSALFGPLDGTEAAMPLQDEDIGIMVGALYDLTVNPREQKLGSILRRTFHARVIGGVLDIDPTIAKGGSAL